MQRPGAKVEVGTVLLEMRNPDVMLQALDAERLASGGLTSSMDIDRARDNLDEAHERQDSEEQRLALMTESLRALRCD